MIDSKVLNVLYARLDASQKEYDRLIKLSKTETPHLFMGGFEDTDSNYAAGYVLSEIGELQMAIDYHSGVKRPFGWTYKYEDWDKISSVFDTSVPPAEHPEYLQKVANAVDKKEADDFLVLFTDYNYNGKQLGLNELFQYTYFFQMRNLIPSSALLDLVHSKGRPAYSYSTPVSIKGKTK